MAQPRKALADLLRPRLKPPGFNDPEFLTAFDRLLDAGGMAQDDPDQPKLTPSGRSSARGRLTVEALQQRLDVPVTGAFDGLSRAALFARLSNPRAPALTDSDFAEAGRKLGVDPRIMRAVRKVEAPRGPFDKEGRPTVLFERHVFRRGCEPTGCFDASHPGISGKAYGPGGYGAHSSQYGKLADACALDPEAAFRACSWGAFQVLGENAVALGYASAFDMALELTTSEAAHLDSFVRFVEANKLVEALRKCRAGDPQSCVPFVRVYNGPGYASYSYHVKLAAAAR
jgi:hypothetical protein